MEEEKEEFKKQIKNEVEKMKAKKIIITLAAAVCLGVAVYAIHGNLANDKPEQHATEETSLDNGMKDHLFGKNLFLDAKLHLVERQNMLGCSR